MTVQELREKLSELLLEYYSQNLETPRIVEAKEVLAINMIAETAIDSVIDILPEWEDKGEN